MVFVHVHQHMVVIPDATTIHVRILQSVMRYSDVHVQLAQSDNEIQNWRGIFFEVILAYILIQRARW